MSVNRGNLGRATSCVATGGRRGIRTGVGGRMGFSATPLEREDFLADTNDRVNPWWELTDREKGNKDIREQ